MFTDWSTETWQSRKDCKGIRELFENDVYVHYHGYIHVSKLIKLCSFKKVFPYGLWETNRVLRGDWARPVLGIKEGTYCMKHWVLYANNESWNTTSKTNYVLYGE